jgi:hypothetical protein
MSPQWIQLMDHVLTIWHAISMTSQMAIPMTLNPVHLEHNQQL